MSQVQNGVTGEQLRDLRARPDAVLAMRRNDVVRQGVMFREYVTDVIDPSSEGTPWIVVCTNEQFEEMLHAYLCEGSHHILNEMDWHRLAMRVGGLVYETFDRDLAWKEFDPMAAAAVGTPPRTRHPVSRRGPLR